MDICGSKASNAIGGRNARACDSCLIKRARWFCAADDAFLCQSCDSSVHSANQLVTRHHRVRLQPSLFNRSWHQGFTKKPRSRRTSKSSPPTNDSLPLVPEINGEDLFPEESVEQLLCRVPVFDPLEHQFCSETGKEEVQIDHNLDLAELMSNCDEFAANVEDLLGLETEENSCINQDQVKIENDDEVRDVIACHLDPKLDMELNWKFDDYAMSSIGGAREEMKKVPEMESVKLEKKTLLRLNYEAVVAAWASQGSPWKDGIRPQLHHLDHFIMEGKRHVEAGREARVWRYKEKRRTRLFSKKIRYQVRKLNAEKRPRMKGRFVKKTN